MLASLQAGAWNLTPKFKSNILSLVNLQKFTNMNRLLQTWICNIRKLTHHESWPKSFIKHHYDYLNTGTCEHKTSEHHRHLCISKDSHPVHSCISPHSHFSLSASKMNYHHQHWSEKFAVDCFGFFSNCHALLKSYCCYQV